MGLNMIPESCHVKTCLMPGMQNQRPERRKHLDISGIACVSTGFPSKREYIYYRASSLETESANPAKHW